MSPNFRFKVGTDGQIVGVPTQRVGQSSIATSTLVSETRKSFSTIASASSSVTAQAETLHQPPELKQREGSPYYITLTITRDGGSYVTVVQLSDTSYPTSFSSSLSPTAHTSHPTISTGSIVGIALGLTLGFLLLIGVLYVYLLRARQFRRVKRRKKMKRGGSTSTGGGGPGPPPPPPPAAAPPPPAAPAAPV